MKKCYSLVIILFYHPGVSMSTPNNQKKSFNRPKSAEPGSPLLRRALSPDRLHPRSAENKTSISPLANTVVKVNPRVTIAQTSNTATEDVSDITKESNESKTDKKAASEQKVTADYTKLTHGISINIGNVVISNSCGSTQLPRIAEEKDSPTGSKTDDYSSKVGEICESMANEQLQESTNDDNENDSNRLKHIKKEMLPDESTLIGKKNDEEVLTKSDKNIASSSTSSGTSSSSTFNKNIVESSPECRKILKRYKFEGLSFGLTSHDKMKQDSEENKKNK